MNGIKNDKGRNFIWFALFNLVKFEKKNTKKKKTTCLKQNKVIPFQSIVAFSLILW